MWRDAKYRPKYNVGMVPRESVDRMVGFSGSRDYRLIVDLQQYLLERLVQRLPASIGQREDECCRQ